MNQAESERLGALLDAWGMSSTKDPRQADLILLNSCVVRQSAQDRVTGRLDALKELKAERTELAVAVTGCLVDGNTDQLGRRYPQVDAFFKAGAFDQFREWARERGFDGHAVEVRPSGSVTAFVPIIEGCDNFCTYCIVPYRRGRQRSRSLADIVQEVSRLADDGTKEVTLLGQNVNAYGHDLFPAIDLADLLTELNRVKLERIRFLTSHPRDMTPRAIAAVAELDRVCPHMSLPLQAGDDDILAAMKRGYSADDYRRLIADIRKAIPDVGISTDIIVGFPGETDAQFQHTCDMVGELRFDTVHVASYSPRPGTFAARKLKNDVPSPEKKQRQRTVEALQETIATEVNAALMGRTVEILVEGRSAGRWSGRTRNNKLVFFEDGGEWLGKLACVKIGQTGPWWLTGTIVPDCEGRAYDFVPSPLRGEG